MGKKKRSSTEKKTQGVKTDQGNSWIVMNQVKPPEPLNFQDSAGWPAWIKRYKMFHSAVGLTTASEERQINMLLYCMGSEAEDLLSSLEMTESRRTSFNSVVSAFEEYFILKKNKFYNRTLFFERNQKLEENIDGYLNELTKLSEKCDWSCELCKSKDFKDQMILLKLVTGICDKSLSKDLQSREVTTLSEVVEIIKESEARKNRISEISKGFTAMNIGSQSPGTQTSKRETESSSSKRNPDTASACRPISVLRSQERTPQTYFQASFHTRQEERGNMRSSFSSGDTGDEWCFDTDEEDAYLEFLHDYDRKSYLSYISSMSDQSSSSVKPTYLLGESWPALEKPRSKVDDSSKSFEHYHFSVSGRQSRKGLRKMCQNSLKNSY